MDALPDEVFSKIILYNSTVLADLFKSRLKINSLMILFRLGNGRYKRLWHYMEPTYGSKWAYEIEEQIQMHKLTKHMLKILCASPTGVG